MKVFDVERLSRTAGSGGEPDVVAWVVIATDLAPEGTYPSARGALDMALGEGPDVTAGLYRTIERGDRAFQVVQEFNVSTRVVLDVADYEPAPPPGPEDLAPAAGDDEAF